MKRVFKKFFITTGVLLLLLIIAIMAFVSFAPQFGAAPTGEHLERIKSSPNYADGNFINLIETELSFSPRAVVQMVYNFATAKNTAPKDSIPVKFDESGKTGEEANPDNATYITWYGHSAVLVEMDGMKLLIDPMLGTTSSPVAFFGRRFPYEEPINISDLKSIDAVLISHDHYDHLDYPSIKDLHKLTGHFYVPLGVGSHLKHWGVPPEKITEMDWWDSATFGTLTFTATPARHFSGRGLGDRNKTLWASWAIKGKNDRIYFSGDSGYGPHFREVAEKLGPFDFAMIECGQYNELWEDIHMLPDQSVNAALDINSKVVMPIHWGAFSLAPHTWQEPAEKFTAGVLSAGLNVVTPYIGERIKVGHPYPQNEWWQGVR
ncbi:MAG: MBL fold metallo-hydrolase [Bacteroidia bacterium]